MLGAPVVIICTDTDFAGTVALHMQNELHLACRVAANAEEAKAYATTAQVVITTESSAENFDCPVITVRNPPVKMQDLLDDTAIIIQNNGTEKLSPEGVYLLKSRQKELCHGASGKTVVLTDTEIRLLQYLADQKGQVASKDQLLKNVWGFGETIDTHTLETHIYRLRGKFRELSGDDSAIAAIEGGYRLEL